KYIDGFSIPIPRKLQMEPRIAGPVEQRRKVGMRQGGAQQMADIELRVRAVGAFGGQKADDDVGKRSLRMNEIGAVLLAPLQGGNYVLKFVATFGCVAVNLPLDAEIVFGIEIDLHVVAIAHSARGVPQQPFGDDELRRLEVLRPAQSA